MKQEDFFEALGDMDDKYIQEAKEETKGTRKAEKEEDTDKTRIRKKKVGKWSFQKRHRG